MTDKQDFNERLTDIRTAAQKGIDFLGSLSLAQFAADEKTVFAVIRALEIMGEAARKVPVAVRDRHPQVPWRAMAGIRDKLIHDYVTVNLEIVWKTIREDLPPLLNQLDQIIVVEQAAICTAKNSQSPAVTQTPLAPSPPAWPPPPPAT